MSWVILRPTELFVVLNQGQDYVEGYLATKPKDHYEALEIELERIKGELKHPKSVLKDMHVAVQWDRHLTRGIVLSAAGFFVDVFLLDYGVRECCSRSKLYLLPEEYQQDPAYGVRIELENPPTDNLRDTAVIISALRRLSGISARGSVTGTVVEPPTEQNLRPHYGAKMQSSIQLRSEDGKRNTFNDWRLQYNREPGRNASGNSIARSVLREELTKCVKLQKPIIKPPNDLLLEMIGTRCFLTRLLVHRVASPVELICSHYASLNLVRKALDSMDELPVKVPHEKVEVNMLVLVLRKATLHRGIVGAIFDDRESPYRVEFIDLPGYTDATLLYYTPSTIALCAPRALMKVRLHKHVQDIDSGDIVNLLCDSVEDNTACGSLVRSDNQNTTVKLYKSKL